MSLLSSPRPSDLARPEVRLRCQFERFAAIARELAVLSSRQHAEVGEGYEPYAPDWEQYFSLDRAGACAVWTARTIDMGGLAGYVIWVTTRGLHCVETIIAEAKLFYLAPEHREGMTGYKMLKSSIEAIKAAAKPDIIRVETNALYESGRVGGLLSRLGMQKIGEIYARRR